MAKKKMAKTRIHLANGNHVDVQGKYDAIEDLLDRTSKYCWVHLDLTDGTPVSFQKCWIAYITKA